MDIAHSVLFNDLRKTLTPTVLCVSMWLQCSNGMQTKTGKTTTSEFLQSQHREVVEEIFQNKQHMRLTRDLRRDRPTDRQIERQN